MAEPVAASYSSGTSDVPLLGETIDANLRRAVAAHGDREALVDVSTGTRLTYAELDEAVDAVARGLLARGVARGDRVGIWAPNCVAVVPRPVRDGAHRRDPRQHQPGLPHARAEVRAPAGRHRDARVGRPVQDQRVPRDDRGGPRRAARPRRRRLPRTTRAGTTCSRPARPSRREQVADASAQLSFDDPINIQYTSGTTGFPKGATLSHHNILNNGYFVGEGMSLHRTRTGSACPVPFYHCFGMVMGNLASHLARRVRGDPGAGLRPGRDAASGAAGAVHVALRRPDDVHRRARPAGLRRLRPVLAADRAAWPARRARSR